MLAGAFVADIFTQRPTGPLSLHGSTDPAGSGTGENRCVGSAPPAIACSTSARPCTGPAYANADQLAMAIVRLSRMSADELPTRISSVPGSTVKPFFS